MSDTWTLRRIIDWIHADLGKRGIDSARLEADLLVCHALGMKRIGLYLDLERPLVPSELTAIRALLERRRKREPIAYILGDREFYGRSFVVTPAVLIPRPDTETLVEQALRWLTPTREGRVLDLCTGSGAVALTLAAERPDRQVVATDLSSAALEIARTNALRLGVEARVELREGDLTAVLTDDERYVCITVNPPYVTSAELAELEPDVRDFEPRLALDGGGDGLDFYRRISREVPRFLTSAGVLLVEVGYQQAERVSELFVAAGLTEVATFRDLGGNDRVVSAHAGTG